MYLMLGDTVASEPVVLDLSDATFRTWVVLGVTSAAGALDGVIPLGVVKRLVQVDAIRERQMAELESAGLVKPIDGGYELTEIRRNMNPVNRGRKVLMRHDSREQDEERRRQNRERKRLERERERARHDGGHDGSHAVTHGGSLGTGTGTGTGVGSGNGSDKEESNNEYVEDDMSRCGDCGYALDACACIPMPDADFEPIPFT